MQADLEVTMRTRNAMRRNAEEDEADLEEMNENEEKDNDLHPIHNATYVYSEDESSGSIEHDNDINVKDNKTYHNGIRKSRRLIDKEDTSIHTQTLTESYQKKQ